MHRHILSAALLLLLSTPLLAADAAALYKSKCAMCHGDDGTGATTMGKKLGLRDLGSADVQKQTDAQLFDVVSKGKNKMPAYNGKIADADIKALVAHLRTFK